MSQVTGTATSSADESLIALLASADAAHGLEALFTPLEPADPVEQLVRRT